MRSTDTVARKFIETRADWKRNLLPDGDALRAGKAEAAARALAWVLGIDLNLMEQPKKLAQVEAWYRANADEAREAREAREAQAVSDAQGPVSVIPVSLGAVKEGDIPGGRWYLLDVPPHQYPDGYRTELWSALFSQAQVEELSQALEALEAVAITQLTSMTSEHADDHSEEILRFEVAGASGVAESEAEE